MGTEPQPIETMQSILASGHNSCASRMAKMVGLLATIAPSCQRYTSKLKREKSQTRWQWHGSIETEPVRICLQWVKSFKHKQEYTIRVIIKIIRCSRWCSYGLPYPMLTASHESISLMFNLSWITYCSLASSSQILSSRRGNLWCPRRVLHFPNTRVQWQTNKKEIIEAELV